MNSGESKHPAHVVHELLNQIGELVMRRKRDPAQLTRYLQPVISQPETYASVLNRPPRQAGFIAGIEPELWVPEWEQFYRQVYGLADVNLLPAFRKPTGHLDHVWPVFCDPRIGLNRTWAETCNLHPARCFHEDLEKVVTKNDRSAAVDGLYMVRFRARVEADVECKGLSESKLAELGISGITLDERLKLGQFVWWKTGGFHLDSIVATLCAGSCYYNNPRAPMVFFNSGRVHIGELMPGFSGPEEFSTRSAVL